MNHNRILTSLSLIALLSASLVHGQTGLATITGTLTDQTGAVLPNIPIEVRNIATGSISNAATTTTGNFTITQLAIGDYQLTIEASGFKRYVHNNFHLAAAQIMREDVRLEVGQNTESVTVTADASLLKTESSEVTHNVTLSQLNNLPILVVGSTGSGFRDPYAAVRLAPGITYNGGANAASGTPSVATTMSINGTPANTYQTRLDGMTMNPTGPRLMGANMQTQPSVDAIQEVAIQTSNFAAEFGAAGGAMINMVTKSGTNAFHGTAYDYGTNEALNAHQPYLGLRNKIRQNDFGGTFGGPIRIPKVYNGTNKTFFFFSFEMFKQTNIVNSSVNVPIAPFRTGDFSSMIPAENRLITVAAAAGACPAGSIPSGVSGTCNVVDGLGRTIQSGTIFDPSTTVAVAGGKNNRDPFVGNRIPVTSFDPISKKVLALLPNPQGPNFASGLASNNYTGTYDASRTSKIPSIKLDHNLSAKGRLSFYLQETNTHSPRSSAGAESFPDLLTGGVTTFSSGTTVRVNYDYTLLPTLLLHVGAGWNDSDFKIDGPVNNYNARTELGLVGATLDKYFPRIETGTIANNLIGGLSSIGQWQPTSSYERRPSGNVSASWVKGTHTYKFGVDYRLEKFPNYNREYTNGRYIFGANATEQPFLQGLNGTNGSDGFQFASFLLGGMSQNEQRAPVALMNQKSQTGIYAQDTWKVTRKLSFDYGLRWDLGTYAREQYGRNGSAGLAIPNPAASGRLGATQFESVCKCNFASNYMYAFGPRLGVAYQINSKTVIRAGWGVVYNATSTSSGSVVNSALSGAFPANSGLTTGQFVNGMPSTVHAEWPSFNPGVGQTVGDVRVFPILLDPNAGRPARLMQWNIALQREISRNLVVEASYVGNRGVWWTANALAPLNYLSQDTLIAAGFTNFASATEAALVNTPIQQLSASQKSQLASRGVSLKPYPNFPETQTVRQSLRDYPQYTDPTATTPGGLAGSPLGKTWYDSLQLNVTKRFSHGLTANLNYNFSKNLDLMSTPDVYNRQLGKTYSGNDIPHQLRMTFQYQVAEFKDRGLPVLSNKWVSYALSGWGLGGYLSYQSAALLARPANFGATPISQFLGRGPGSGAQLKKNADGSFMSPWSVDWTDYSGKHHTDPLDINCHCYDPTKTIALNPLAWENVPAGQWAADQSDLRFFRGMRRPSESANFSRNFRIKEGIALNVRVEFSNIFNRTFQPNPSTGVNFANAPVKFNDPKLSSYQLYNTGFGVINPITTGTTGQRTGSFVARLTF